LFLTFEKDQTEIGRAQITRTAKEIAFLRRVATDETVRGDLADRGHGNDEPLFGRGGIAAYQVDAISFTGGINALIELVEGFHAESVADTDAHRQLGRGGMHLGYKSVVVNLSDIYAMNATPTQLTVSIGISNRFSVEALDEFYEGVYAACETYGVDLVGGDTASSKKGFVISMTAIGEVTPDRFVRRNTAQKGDLLCCTGDLGAAYLGLIFLEREKKIFLENPNVKADLENEKYVIGRLLKPDARKDIIEFFQQSDVLPTAMMDISDGLSSEVLHICRQSNLGCVLYEEKI